MNLLEGKLLAEGQRIGIVAGRFNEFITSKLLGGALDAFKRHGGDEGSAVLLVEHNVSALGAERDFNCVSELIDTSLESLAGFLTVNDLFCHDELPPIILR